MGKLLYDAPEADFVVTPCKRLRGQERTHLFADAGEDDEKGEEDGEEDEVQCESVHVPRDRRSVVVAVQGGAAIVSERVEPALHDGVAPLKQPSTDVNTSATQIHKQR